MYAPDQKTQELRSGPGARWPGRRSLRAAAAALAVGALVFLAGCGVATTLPTNAGTSVDPSSLPFPEEAADADGALVERADAFLSSLVAEAWSEAYQHLDTASRTAETPEGYAARWDASAIRLEGYELRGALVLPGLPDQGVVRTELYVRNQKSEETWLEYLWLIRESDEWRVGSASWK